ncbi:MAG: hydrogenase expression/formation protein HypE [Desulfosarcinaceae bacterium]|nr:hydrogenase expression/formation protein HypE [Desulfosarcinaceae bacterium]
MTFDKITLDHGSGGKVAHALTADLLLPRFGNPTLTPLNDGAVLTLGGQRLAFSTDTFTVDPLFFPGGDIGELAVNGTVNDVAMCGARPLYLSMGLIIEEGFARRDLERILDSMQRAVGAAGVDVVTGDTKVVPRGAADKLFINTSGVGVIPAGISVGAQGARPGDSILISGTMADHGMTILTQREGLSFEGDLRSDTAALNHLVERMLAVCPDIHVLRDPTRGGVGTTLNEIAQQSQTGIRLREADLPVRPAVAGACELLGFDPLYVANEGKLLAFVPADAADAVLRAMQADINGRDASVIGTVVDDHPGRVYMKTRIGGERIVDMLTGEQLPRIC